MTLVFRLPPLSTTEALLLTVTFGLTYVGSLYISKHARLSFASNARPPRRAGEERRKQDNERWRDDPDVIRARLVAVTIASLCNCALIFAALYRHIGASKENVLPALNATLVRLGFSLPSLNLDNVFPHLIAPLLFLGPLYAVFLDFTQPYYRTSTFKDLLFSWQGLRNYVVAPITEELVFRACVLTALHLAGATTSRMIMLAPLSFGVAHLHHAWDTYNRYGRTREAANRAIIMTVFQLSYTTLFGSFASYLFLRTGSIFPPISAHIFCNIMGIPQISYEVQKYPKHKRLIYLAYITGILGFALKLEPWTRLPSSLYWKVRTPVFYRFSTKNCTMTHSTEENHNDKAPGYHYHGDYFAQSQLGGNAGGKNNTNTIYNGNEDDLLVVVKRLEAQLQANAFKGHDIWGAIGQVSETKEKCSDLLKRCTYIEAQLKAKVGISHK
ncbi:hypothetical protein ONZ45_g10325 [Pleurotus djamor]|nr:hypothetical protein ONZ45_g10325 [Pleurotus djamor]